jgi:hypothetical protein
MDGSKCWNGATSGRRVVSTAATESGPARDAGQDGILRRANIDGAERADKILKNPDLEAPHRIAGVAGQRVEGDLVIHDVAL